MLDFISIPSIGDHLRLLEDWEFTLYAEKRILNMAKAIEAIPMDAARYKWESKKALGQTHYDMEDWGKVTIPAGTVLTVDRIYVRKNLGEYDSVSFIIVKNTCSDDRIARRGFIVRFWAKLNEVNGLSVEPVVQVKKEWLVK